MTAKLHDSNIPRSRRSLFKWMGQITAGASLVGIGFVLSSQKVLAEPDCTPCSGCLTVSCEANGNCRANNPQYPIEVKYQLYQGCIPAGGQCSLSSYLYECNNTCACYS